MRLAGGLSCGLACLLAATGCRLDQRVDIDTTTEPIRFLVTHRGWPTPFIFPNVNEFAIASDEDKLIWQVHANPGTIAPSLEFAIIYGRIPQGFEQIFPENNGAPDQLVPERVYYVAAGSKDPWTEEYVYRMVFSLPVQRPRDRDLPGTPRRSRGMPSPAKPTKPPASAVPKQPSGREPGMRPIDPPKRNRRSP